ncbi:hypothetical protein KCTC52924_02859 [Arenibacter antarcticus]|uniref:Uncharacterized protein n=1 Tax=Arenibacter antarcticus TaxID=2040469 RepID=A0ABW5VH38_9FLAO|nr:hypothetical protein [Arenibacter sp. H213]MCM4167277.1 hypothetical protein [Arenibacter sp. H213]
MKQIVLFVAIIMLIKPFWPLAEYAVNYDYIVENLCKNRDTPSLNCNGQCYLAKQLAKESDNGKENPFEGKRSQTEIQFLASIDPVSVRADVAFGIISVQNNFKGGQAMISRLFTSDIAQPPELG